MNRPALRKKAEPVSGHSASITIFSTLACLVLGCANIGCTSSRQAPQNASSSSQPSPAATKPAYSLHENITATVFWVGEQAAGSSPANTQSAWDDRWQEHFGGVDDPGRLDGSRPAGFVPRENPFYFALPYNDFAHGRRKADAATVVPWAAGRTWDLKESMCKNRWIRITRAGRSCYAQWEDVGPFVTDDAAYVFGTAAPRNRSNKQAGLDVSPAVRDYLRLGGMDKVSWQFVEAAEVPDGAWKKIVTTSGICWK